MDWFGGPSWFVGCIGFRIGLEQSSEPETKGIRRGHEGKGVLSAHVPVSIKRG